MNGTDLSAGALDIIELPKSGLAAIDVHLFNDVCLINNIAYEEKDLLDENLLDLLTSGQS